MFTSIDLVLKRDAAIHLKLTYSCANI